ncbi:MAG: YggT family protein [Chloroflexota bacterium]
MSWLASFVSLLFWALKLAILIRVLLSWIRPNPYNPFVQAIYQITEPIMGPLRRIIPPLGMIDITPMVALIILQIVQGIVLSAIRSLYF